MKRGEGAGSRFSPVFALVALSGGLMAAAFPGTGDLGWLAFVALVPLLVAIAESTRRRAAGLGFVAGLVFWLATIPWVAQTMVRYGGLSWPLASLVLLGLVGYLALYTAAFCALLCRVQASGLFTRVVLSGAINSHTGGSFYTRHGDLFAWGTVGIAIVTAIGSLTPIVLLSWGTPRDGIPTRGGSSSRPL